MILFCFLLASFSELFVSQLGFAQASLQNSANLTAISDSPLDELKAAHLAESTENWEQALHHYANVTQGKPSPLRTYAYFLSGRLLQAQNRCPDAEKALSQSLLERTWPTALKLEAKARIGQCAAQLGDFKKAREQLQPILKRLRGSPVYAATLFQYLRASRIPKISCKMLRELYANYPSLPDLKNWGPDLPRNEIDGKKVLCQASAKDLAHRIRNLQYSGENERAQKEIAQAHKLPPPPVLEEAASEKASEGGDAESEEPASVDQLYANFLLGEGKIDEAARLLLSNEEKWRKQFWFNMLLAKVAARAEEYPIAVGSFYRAYQLRPHSKEGKEALFQSAFLSYQHQDYDGANRKFTEFINKFGGSSLAGDAKWHLAWIRYLRGDYSGALDSFGKLPLVQIRHVRKRRHRTLRTIAIDSPTRERIQYWQAMCYLRLGQSSDAIKLFQRLAQDPSYGYYSLMAYYRWESLTKTPTPGAEKLVDKAAGPALPKSDVSNTDTIAESENIEESEEAPEAEVSDEMAPATPPPEIPSEQEAEKATEKATEKAEAEAPIEKRFSIARDLFTAGFADVARKELIEAESHARSFEDRKALIREYAKIGEWFRSSSMAELTLAPQRLRGGLSGARDLWESAFPKAYPQEIKSALAQIDVQEYWVLSIMRAESHYREEAFSPVGALGLMQLMPFTAKKVGDLLGDKVESLTPSSILNSKNNIRLGARYLQRLQEQFHSLPLVAAAYNSGPHRVQAWVKAFGVLEMDEFIEHIPYLETRNYVKKVIRNDQLYELIYKGQQRNLQWFIKPLDPSLSGSFKSQEIW